MSSWGLTAPEGPVSRASHVEHDEPPVRRVREEVRDSVAVCICTLCASTVVALALTLLSKLAG